MAWEAEFYDGSITAAEVKEVLFECPGDKSPRLDGLLYEFYKSIPDLVGNILVSVYAKWQ